MVLRLRLNRFLYSEVHLYGQLIQFNVRFLTYSYS